jgi:hypothetical protein
MKTILLSLPFLIAYSSDGSSEAIPTTERLRFLLHSARRIEIDWYNIKMLEYQNGMVIIRHSVKNS